MRICCFAMCQPVRVGGARARVRLGWAWVTKARRPWAWAAITKGSGPKPGWKRRMIPSCGGERRWPWAWAANADGIYTRTGPGRAHEAGYRRASAPHDEASQDGQADRRHRRGPPARVRHCKGQVPDKWSSRQLTKDGQSQAGVLGQFLWNVVLDVPAAYY